MKSIISNNNENRSSSMPIVSLSKYLKTPEALWRMLASYPKDMPVEDAVRHARIDFTRCRKEVAV